MQFPILRGHLHACAGPSRTKHKNGWEFCSPWVPREILSALRRAVPPLCARSGLPCSVASLRRFPLPQPPGRVHFRGPALARVCTWSGHAIDVFRGLCAPRPQSTNLAPARVTEGRGTFQLTTIVKQSDGPIRFHALGRNAEREVPSRSLAWWGFPVPTVTQSGTFRQDSNLRDHAKRAARTHRPEGYLEPKWLR